MVFQVSAYVIPQASPGMHIFTGMRTCLAGNGARFLKTGSNFLFFYFYCSIVFIIILYKKWGLEFLTTALLPKTAIAGRVNAVLTPF